MSIFAMWLITWGQWIPERKPELLGYQPVQRTGQKPPRRNPSAPPAKP